MCSGGREGSADGRALGLAVVDLAALFALGVLGPLAADAATLAAAVLAAGLGLAAAVAPIGRILVGHTLSPRFHALIVRPPPAFMRAPGGAGTFFEKISPGGYPFSPECDILSPTD